MSKPESNKAPASRYRGPVGFVRMIAETVSEAMRLRDEAMKRYPRSYIVE